MLYSKVAFFAAIAQGAVAINVKADDTCADDGAGLDAALDEIDREFAGQIPDDDDDDNADDDDDGPTGCGQATEILNLGIEACTIEAYNQFLTDNGAADQVPSGAERDYLDQGFCAMRQYCPITCAGASGAPNNAQEEYCALECSSGAHMHVGLMPVMVVALAALKNVMGAQ